ncbi:hypothetical protein [Streptomyces fragilis]|uniref:Peptidase inhibitor family I36 n=1 Tax=Streptomyces fragilis TaxID=67301 RepID=A0ABV2YIW5_9ACTN|nr:hypothetical protein [Streptomyces fragilis]
MKRTGKAAAFVAAAVTALSGAFITPASAATSYVSDVCTSSNNTYCFQLNWGSRGETTWVGLDACFVSNQDVPDYYGYSPNGATLVRYVFRHGELNDAGTGLAGLCRGEGGGEAVKNNAASGANAECSATHRVYFNSGYGGISQAFLPDCGTHWPSQNLVSSLKNENASADRY